MRTCGHGREPRRVCEPCLDARAPFLACSLACLTAHHAEAHPDDARGTAARVADYQARVNRNVAENREWYAAHRARVTALVGAASRGGDLCVLGAGNGSDLDLPALAERFAEIHLVDLDGEALERCRAGAPAALRERLVLHGGVDLSGFTARLDDWGEVFPSEAELGQAAQPAIHGILRRLGRTFDVVASTCALSQLAVPYHRAWLLPASAWASLHAAITAVHLATIAGATTPGGTGLLIFDVLSSQKAPELRALADAGPAPLAAFLDEHARRGGALEPSPQGLLARLATLGRLVAAPRLSAPWLWNIGAETQLVYGLAFTRAPA
ncbi:MAG TPA: hypothetical protein VHL80_09260 [Polyangia bacterium]|nr:hypothetical protein [Polyangia bacterium]